MPRPPKKELRGMKREARRAYKLEHKDTGWSCFWVWPWGHFWEAAGIIGEGMQCRFCTKVTSDF